MFILHAAAQQRYVVLQEVLLMNHVQQVFLQVMFT
jgi:hypothetical protein